MEEASPHLKAAFMEVVDNQIRDNDPPETRETFNRLIAQGISKQNARIYIGQAVCVEVWDILKNKKEFNRERFVRNLKNLPEEPKEGNAQHPTTRNAWQASNLSRSERDAQCRRTDDRRQTTDNGQTYLFSLINSPTLRKF